MSAPTAPLAIPIEANYGGGTYRAEGEHVAPGLAIGPAIIDAATVPGLGAGKAVAPGRYVLVHAESGRSLTRRFFCRRHVEAAAELAVAAGVDWTRPADDVDPRLAALRKALYDMRGVCCPGWDTPPTALI